MMHQEEVFHNPLFFSLAQEQARNLTFFGFRLKSSIKEP